MPRSVRLASDTLVGRDDDLRGVMAVLGDLHHGRPAVVQVSGPAGIGKTRFVTALADRLRAAETRVLVGACLDVTVGAAPYSALIAAFRSVDPPAVDVLDALTGAVSTRRSRLFELLRASMVALARKRPTVLVMEDLHWSDRITRDALRYLTAMARDGRWALVVTFRDDEAAARPAVGEFLDVLHRDTRVRVTLRPLSPAEVVTQVAGITGAPPAPEDAERVHRRSGGIPLLVEEIVAAEAVGITGVPEQLRDLYIGRVRRLGARAARAVEVVAVAGDQCDERLVGSVLNVDPATVGAALDGAVEANVLAAAGTGYRMRHELLREAVYGAVPPARRRQLHRRVAAALQTRPVPDVAALAYHWFQADEPTQAALANLAAADLAERVHAPVEVQSYLRGVLVHAAALPAERAAAVGGRAGLLARAAEAAYLGGAFEQAVELAEQCIAAGAKPAELAVRWERLARYRWVARDGAGTEEAHERSLALLPDDAPVAARIRVLAGYAWHLAMWGRTTDARRWSEPALAAADAGGEPLDRCRALLAWGLTNADQDAGLAALREARDLAAECDASDELLRAYAGIDLAHRRLGRIAEREPALRDGLALAVAHGLNGTYAPVMRYLLAELLLHCGRWDEAGELLDQITASRAGGVPAVFTHAYRARLAAARGDAASLAADVERVAALALNLPQQPVPGTVAACAQAELCLWTGAAEEALEHLGSAHAVPNDPLWPAEADALRARAAADLAESARRRGQPTAQPAVTDGGDPRAMLDSAHPRIRAHGATIVAELARRDGRREPAPWRAAVAAWEDAGDPYPAAYCRWRLAHALLAKRSGRPEAARELTAAHRTATRLGAGPLRAAVEGLATAARIELAGAGRPLGPVAVATDLGLTHRELEIVPFLVAGRTNAEIAEALVISPRTVGVHVSRILRKLGATRRTEAADIARRRGLVSS
ncbi:MAG TPA: AAA family ATPase [Jiangellaceae bacterium]|nr:AAA family ATPase [Jiangellaceae bacterium]